MQPGQSGETNQESPKPLRWGESLGALFLGALVIFIGFVVGKLEASLFWVAALLAVVAVLAAAVCGVLFSNLLLLPRLRAAADQQVETAARQQEVLTDLRALASESLSSYEERLEALRMELGLDKSYLISDPVLASYERNLACDEVWIVTDELLVELGGKKDPLYDFLDIMKKNLARGVKYTYIVPDRIHIHSRRDAILRQFEGYTDARLRFVTLTEDLWQRLPVSFGEYLIYGPYAGGNDRVYYLLPTERSPRVRHWVRVGRDLDDYWIGRTATAIESVGGSTPVS